MATTVLAPTKTRQSRRTRYLLLALLICCDVLAVNLGFLLSYRWHLDDILREFQPPTPDEIAWAVLTFNLIFGFAFWANGLYRMQRGGSRVDEAYQIFRGISIGTVVIIAFNTLLPLLNITTRTLVIGWLLAMVLAVIVRFIYHNAVRSMRARGIDTRTVLIVGANDIGQLVYRQMGKTPELGYRVIGFLSDEVPAGQIVVGGVPVLGKRRRLGQV
ncbi:MAG TPA: undecaprenyl-phosphate glucose phosphotransferase, partial [Herpetosiphonaceae bacterium]|nr:undecaprenyl-phosphate glucose phosphotransferase [Herpetosiphonaceae bacterium]